VPPPSGIERRPQPALQLCHQIRHHRHSLARSHLAADGISRRCEGGRAASPNDYLHSERPQGKGRAFENLIRGSGRARTGRTGSSTRSWYGCSQLAHCVTNEWPDQPSALVGPSFYSPDSPRPSSPPTRGIATRVSESRPPFLLLIEADACLRARWLADRTWGDCCIRIGGQPDGAGGTRPRRRARARRPPAHTVVR
jgi:hypothetical protein